MKLYITDKTGKKFWRTDVAMAYSKGEYKNLQRHLDAIRTGNKAYMFVDADSAKIVEEVEPSELRELTMTNAEAHKFTEMQMLERRGDAMYYGWL